MKQKFRNVILLRNTFGWKCKDGDIFSLLFYPLPFSERCFFLFPSHFPFPLFYEKFYFLMSSFSVQRHDFFTFIFFFLISSLISSLFLEAIPPFFSPSSPFCLVISPHRRSPFPAASRRPQRRGSGKGSCRPTLRRPWACSPAWEEALLKCCSLSLETIFRDGNGICWRKRRNAPMGVSINGIGFLLLASAGHGKRSLNLFSVSAAEPNRTNRKMTHNTT